MTRSRVKIAPSEKLSENNINMLFKLFTENQYAFVQFDLSANELIDKELGDLIGKKLIKIVSFVNKKSNNQCPALISLTETGVSKMLLISRENEPFQKIDACISAQWCL
jgi:hypothetical protein